MPTHTLSGRAVGLTEEQLKHLRADPLPEGVYTDRELAIIRYVRASAMNEIITDRVYDDLAEHYSQQQIIEICFTSGISGLVARFHKTFLTDVDPETLEQLGPSCPVVLPERPPVG